MKLWGEIGHMNNQKYSFKAQLFLCFFHFTELQRKQEVGGREEGHSHLPISDSISHEDENT